MPFPKVTQGYVDQRLTSLLLAHKNDAYFAEKFFPVVPGVEAETGLIPSFGKAHLRSYVSKRALYDESDHRISFEMADDQRFAVEFYDLSIYVPDRIQNQYKTPFDANALAQFTVIEALKLEREIAAANALTSTTILTQNVTLSGTGLFTAKTTSDPIGVIDTAVNAVRAATGHKPNKISIQYNVLQAMRVHPAFTAIAAQQIQGGNGLSVLNDQNVINVIKQQWGFDEVLVPSTVKITSQPGQTVTTGEVWGKDILVWYQPPFGQFITAFTGSFQLGGANMRSVVRRAPKDKGDEVEAMWAYQDAIIDVTAAYLIKNAIN